MYQVFNFQLIKASCPDGMNLNLCPVRQYLKENGLFSPTVNESLFEPTKPYDSSRDEFIAVLDNIYGLCKACRSK